MTPHYSTCSHIRQAPVLAERTWIPVVPCLTWTGSLPCDHPRTLSCLPIHPHTYLPNYPAHLSVRCEPSNIFGSQRRETSQIFCSSQPGIERARIMVCIHPFILPVPNLTLDIVKLQNKTNKTKEKKTPKRERVCSSQVLPP